MCDYANTKSTVCINRDPDESESFCTILAHLKNGYNFYIIWSAFSHIVYNLWEGYAPWLLDSGTSMIYLWGGGGHSIMNVDKYSNKYSLMTMMLTFLSVALNFQYFFEMMILLLTPSNQSWSMFIEKGRSSANRIFYNDSPLGNGEKIISPFMMGQLRSIVCIYVYMTYEN